MNFNDLVKQEELKMEQSSGVDPDLKHLIPDTIKMIQPSDCIMSMSKLVKPGANYSIPVLTKAFAGYTLGASTIIFAPSGQGKTTLVQKEVLNLLKQGYKVSLISTEETPETTFKNIYRAETGKIFDDFETGDTTVDAELHQKKIEAYTKFFDGMELYVPAEVTKLRLDDVVQYVKQCADAGIKHIFLDNISALASKSSLNSSEQTWTVIERVTSTVTDLARTANISLTVIGHTSVCKKDVTQYSIKGGQSLANMFDNIIYLAEAETPAIRDTEGRLITDYKIIEILKARVNASYRGVRIGIQYDPSNHQITECPDIMSAEFKNRDNPKGETLGIVYKDPTDKELRAMDDGEFNRWLQDVEKHFKFGNDFVKEIRERYNTVKTTRKKGSKKDENTDF